MLALSRKIGQTIVIDNQITVTILSIRGNRITLGIDAPREVSIHREEVVTTVFAKSLMSPTLDSLPAVATPASR